jgi:hypothetical protein
LTAEVRHIRARGIKVLQRINEIKVKSRAETLPREIAGKNKEVGVDDMVVLDKMATLLEWEDGEA